ncbi:hypothetical protein Taro_026066 [Colocasia esculenta]|uniref:Uncharacterized protein n=1 Tax=Colocasia esculenta TaxID=4460 RepID=A0A843VIF1_COLES|nr:hypothetical protein [Colocasia esculenta]
MHKKTNLRIYEYVLGQNLRLGRVSSKKHIHINTESPLGQNLLKKTYTYKHKIHHPGDLLDGRGEHMHLNAHTHIDLLDMEAFRA